MRRRYLRKCQTFGTVSNKATDKALTAVPAVAAATLAAAAAEVEGGATVIVPAITTMMMTVVSTAHTKIHRVAVAVTSVTTIHSIERTTRRSFHSTTSSLQGKGGHDDNNIINDEQHVTNHQHLRHSPIAHFIIESASFGMWAIAVEEFANSRWSCNGGVAEKGLLSHEETVAVGEKLLEMLNDAAAQRKNSNNISREGNDDDEIAQYVLKVKAILGEVASSSSSQTSSGACRVGEAFSNTTDEKKISSSNMDTLTEVAAREQITSAATEAAATSTAADAKINQSRGGGGGVSVGTSTPSIDNNATPIRNVASGAATTTTSIVHDIPSLHTALDGIIAELKAGVEHWKRYEKLCGGGNFFIPSSVSSSSSSIGRGGSGRGDGVSSSGGGNNNSSNSNNNSKAEQLIAQLGNGKFSQFVLPPSPQQQQQYRRGGSNDDELMNEVVSHVSSASSSSSDHHYGSSKKGHHHGSENEEDPFILRSSRKSNAAFTATLNNSNKDVGRGRNGLTPDMIDTRVLFLQHQYDVLFNKRNGIASKSKQQKEEDDNGDHPSDKDDKHRCDLVLKDMRWRWLDALELYKNVCVVGISSSPSTETSSDSLSSSPPHCRHEPLPITFAKLIEICSFVIPAPPRITLCSEIIPNPAFSASSPSTTMTSNNVDFDDDDNGDESRASTSLLRVAEEKENGANNRRGNRSVHHSSLSSSSSSSPSPPPFIIDTSARSARWEREREVDKAHALERFKQIRSLVGQLQEREQDRSQSSTTLMTQSNATIVRGFDTIGLPPWAAVVVSAEQHSTGANNNNPQAMGGSVSSPSSTDSSSAADGSNAAVVDALDVLVASHMSGYDKVNPNNKNNHKTNKTSSHDHPSYPQRRLSSPVVPLRGSTKPLWETKQNEEKQKIAARHALAQQHFHAWMRLLRQRRQTKNTTFVKNGKEDARAETAIATVGGTDAKAGEEMVEEEDRMIIPFVPLSTLLSTVSGCEAMRYEDQKKNLFFATKPPRTTALGGSALTENDDDGAVHKQRNDGVFINRDGSVTTVVTGSCSASALATNTRGSSSSSSVEIESSSSASSSPSLQSSSSSSPSSPISIGFIAWGSLLPLDWWASPEDRCLWLLNEYATRWERTAAETERMSRGWMRSDNGDEDADEDDGNINNNDIENEITRNKGDEGSADENNNGDVVVCGIFNETIAKQFTTVLAVTPRGRTTIAASLSTTTNGDKEQERSKTTGNVHAPLSSSSSSFCPSPKAELSLPARTPSQLVDYYRQGIEAFNEEEKHDNNATASPSPFSPPFPPPLDSDEKKNNTNKNSTTSLHDAITAMLKHRPTRGLLLAASQAANRLSSAKLARLVLEGRLFRGRLLSPPPPPPPPPSPLYHPQHRQREQHACDDNQLVSSSSSSSPAATSAIPWYDLNLHQYLDVLEFASNAYCHAHASEVYSARKEAKEKRLRWVLNKIERGAVDSSATMEKYLAEVLESQQQHHQHQNQHHLQPPPTPPALVDIANATLQTRQLSPAAVRLAVVPLGARHQWQAIVSFTRGLQRSVFYSPAYTPSTSSSSSSTINGTTNVCCCSSIEASNACELASINTTPFVHLLLPVIANNNDGHELKQHQHHNGDEAKANTGTALTHSSTTSTTATPPPTTTTDCFQLYDTLGAAQTLFHLSTASYIATAITGNIPFYLTGLRRQVDGLMDEVSQCENILKKAQQALQTYHQQQLNPRRNSSRDSNSQQEEEALFLLKHASHQVRKKIAFVRGKHNLSLTAASSSSSSLSSVDTNQHERRGDDDIATNHDGDDGSDQFITEGGDHISKTNVGMAVSSKQSSSSPSQRLQHDVDRLTELVAAMRVKMHAITAVAKGITSTAVSTSTTTTTPSSSSSSLSQQSRAQVGGKFEENAGGVSDGRGGSNSILPLPPQNFWALPIKVISDASSRNMPHGVVSALTALRVGGGGLGGSKRGQQSNKTHHHNKNATKGRGEGEQNDNEDNDDREEHDDVEALIGSMGIASATSSPQQQKLPAAAGEMSSSNRNHKSKNNASSSASSSVRVLHDNNACWAPAVKLAVMWYHDSHQLRDPDGVAPRSPILEAFLRGGEEGRRRQSLGHATSPSPIVFNLIEREEGGGVDGGEEEDSGKLPTRASPAHLKRQGFPRVFNVSKPAFKKRSDDHHHHHPLSLLASSVDGDEKVKPSSSASEEVKALSQSLSAGSAESSSMTATDGSWSAVCDPLTIYRHLSNITTTTVKKKKADKQLFLLDVTTSSSHQQQMLPSMPKRFGYAIFKAEAEKAVERRRKETKRGEQQKTNSGGGDGEEGEGREQLAATETKPTDSSSFSSSPSSPSFRRWPGLGVDGQMTVASMLLHEESKRWIPFYHVEKLRRWFTARELVVPNTTDSSNKSASSSSTSDSDSNNLFEMDDGHGDGDEDASPLTASSRRSNRHHHIANKNNGDDNDDDPHAPLSSSSSSTIDYRAGRYRADRHHQSLQDAQQEMRRQRGEEEEDRQLESQSRSKFRTRGDFSGNGGDGESHGRGSRSVSGGLSRQQQDQQRFVGHAPIIRNRREDDAFKAKRKEMDHHFYHYNKKSHHDNDNERNGRNRPHYDSNDRSNNNYHQRQRHERRQQQSVNNRSPSSSSSASAYVDPIFYESTRVAQPSVLERTKQSNFTGKHRR